MPNFVALTVFAGDNASASTSVAFPTTGASIAIEQVSTPFPQGGASIVSRIIVLSGGLNSANFTYNSAQTVTALVAALGIGYARISVYRTLQSSAPIDVALAANSGAGMLIQPVTGTSIGAVPILSQITFTPHGLRQTRRTYLSAATVAANVIAFG